MDWMHVPVLVAYNYESHGGAGAIVGLAVNEVLPKRMPKIARLGIATLTAVAIGTGKEYVLDQKARPREIWPWGVGAAAALSFRFSF